MKKNNKKILLLFGILTLIFPFFSYVNAEENSMECTVMEKTDIKTKASNIRVTYVPIVVNNDNDTTSRAIDLKIYNVTSDVFLTVSSSSSNVTIDEIQLDYRRIGPDGSITLRIPSVTEVAEYKIEVFTRGTFCSGEVVRTIKITIPKYNFYSQLEACDGISEFYLCQEYITFNIDKSSFYTQTASYKEKKENPELADIIINDSTSAREINALDNSKRKYLIVGLVIAGGVVATFIIIQKNKEKKRNSEIW